MGIGRFALHGFARGEPVSRGFTLVDTHAAYRFTGGAARYEAFVDVTNLTDARLHNSFLRLRAPLPGRAIAAGLRTAF